MTVLICCDFVGFFIFWLRVKYLRMLCIHFDTCIHSNYPFAHSKFMLLVLIHFPAFYMASPCFIHMWWKSALYRFAILDSNSCSDLCFSPYCCIYKCTYSSVFSDCNERLPLVKVSERTPKGFPFSAWLPVIIKHRLIKLSLRFLALRCVWKKLIKNLLGGEVGEWGRHRQCDHMHFFL